MRVAWGLAALVFLSGARLEAELGVFRGPVQNPTFHLETVSDDAEQVACQFDEFQLAILEKLNRVDRGRIAAMEKIVVPDRWDLPENAYSPFPRWFTWAAYFPKAAVVDKRVQAFGAFEHGRLVQWGPVSTGAKESETPNGLFHLNWRSKGHRSTVNRSWFLKWYFNFSNKRGHSFHEYELPGLPASHGCVRMLGRDANWMYNWGDEWALDERGWTVEDPGTPILILGKYDHAAEKPWLTPVSVDLESVPLPGKALDLVAEVLMRKTVESVPGDSRAKEFVGLLSMFTGVANIEPLQPFD